MEKDNMTNGKKGFILSLAIIFCLLVLSGCLFKMQDKPEVTEYSEESASEISLLPENEEVNTAADEASEETFTIIYHNVECKNEGKVYATGKYPELNFGSEFSEKYPNLVTTLNNYNVAWSQSIPETVSGYGYYKIEDDYLPDSTYCSEITASIFRADEKLFTFAESYYDFSGGAHPNHGVTYMNLDPATGETVPLTEILRPAADRSVAEIIRQRLYDTYPDQVEELKAYDIGYDYETGEEIDSFAQKLDNDEYSWALLEDGLWIYFSPYEVAPYAAGYLQINFPYDEFADLINPEYKTDKVLDPDTDVIYADAEETKLVEPKEPEYEDGGDDYGILQVIPNASWSAFVNYSFQKENPVYVTLEKTKEEKSDWLDTTVWYKDNGIAPKEFPYTDGVYKYAPCNPVEYDYMYNELEIYDAVSGEKLYDYDLYTLANGPDEEQLESSAVTQFIRWAKIVDNMLYVEISHSGYASEEPYSAYIVGIDLNTDQVVFRSEPQTANAETFEVVKDCIICGYGFTAEPDYLYILDRFTGERIEKIPVNSAPNHIEAADGTLYVACYNTAYEFKIKDK